MIFPTAGSSRFECAVSRCLSVPRLPVDTATRLARDSPPKSFRDELAGEYCHRALILQSRMIW
jgi:hypothetical protein